MKAHFMKTLQTLTVAAVFGIAAFAPPAASAAGVDVLNEGFSSGPAAPGWVTVNNSSPAGAGWFQGNSGVFGAQAGAADSYAAASYLSTQYGSGTVNNWLMTPALSLSGATSLSFFSRTANDPGYFDKLEVRFASGSGTDPAGFTTLLLTIGPSDYQTAWTQYVAGLNFNGIGRFAFHYFGDADSLNYVGLDSVQVTTAVPEPSLSLMLGLGLSALALARRKLSI
jgi:hypothetical protein